MGTPLAAFRASLARPAGLAIPLSHGCDSTMAPGGVEPPHADSKSAALSAELRGRPNPVCHGGRAILCPLAVAVAQLVEPGVVVPVVGGSSRLRHPSGSHGAL